MKDWQLRDLAKAVVLADLGEPPWECEDGCGAVIERIGCRRGEAVVHHVDENLTNYARENLRLLLGACHRSLHHKGRVKSVEEREKIRQFARVVQLGNKNAVGKRSDESKERMRAAALRRTRG